jgi:hypothetical protein
VAAEGSPGSGQVVADEAEAAVGALEALLGEGALALDLVQFRGGLVQGGLQLLLPALGGRQVVGASGQGHADDQRGHHQPDHDEAGSRHVSPPSGARIEKLRGRPELGGNRTLAADDSTASPLEKPR